MVVGMPGTGIGGLFYLFMAVWMPIHESWRLIRGRSSLARWKFIALNWAIIGGILSCLWVTMLGAKAFMALTSLDKSAVLGARLAPALARDTNQFFASTGYASAISLAALVLIVQVMRFTLGRSAKPSPMAIRA